MNKNIQVGDRVWCPVNGEQIVDHITFLTASSGGRLIIFREGTCSWERDLILIPPSLTEPEHIRAYVKLCGVKI
jgi:hypothetical protein